MRALQNGLAVLFTLAICLTAQAQLAWTNQKQSLDVALGETSAEATFEFTNSGRYPLTLISVTSKENASTTMPDQRTYAPGQSGLISASYNTGKLDGEVTRTILVRTDDARKPLTQLTLQINVPRRIVIEPPIVSWRLDPDTTESEPKIVMITPHPGLGISVTGITLNESFRPRQLFTPKDKQDEHEQSDPQIAELAKHIKYELVKDDASNGYKLTLKPIHDNKPMYLRLWIETNQPDVMRRQNFVTVIVGPRGLLLETPSDAVEPGSEDIGEPSQR